MKTLQVEEIVSQVLRQVWRKKNTHNDEEKAKNALEIGVVCPGVCKTMLNRPNPLGRPLGKKIVFSAQTHLEINL
jgi:hypothetical protein